MPPDDTGARAHTHTPIVINLMLSCEPVNLSGRPLIFKYLPREEEKKKKKEEGEEAATCCSL